MKNTDMRERDPSLSLGIEVNDEYRHARERSLAFARDDTAMEE